MTDTTFKVGQLVQCDEGRFAPWYGYVERFCPNGCCLWVYQTYDQARESAEKAFQGGWLMGLTVEQAMAPSFEDDPLPFGPVPLQCVQACGDTMKDAFIIVALVGLLIMSGCIYSRDIKACEAEGFSRAYCLAVVQ